MTTEPWRELMAQLVALRKAQGIRQNEVAERMNIRQSAVSELEVGGKHEPRLSTLMRYARAVGAKVEVHIEQEQKDDAVG